MCGIVGVVSLALSPLGSHCRPQATRQTSDGPRSIDYSDRFIGFVFPCFIYCLPVPSQCCYAGPLSVPVPCYIPPSGLSATCNNNTVMHQQVQRATALVSPTYRYNPDSVKLGRIVLNYQDPLDTYFDLYPSAGLLESGEIHVTSDSDLVIYKPTNLAKKTSLGGALLQLFRSSRTRTEGKTGLRGDIKRYQLGNPEAHFI